MRGKYGFLVRKLPRIPKLKNSMNKRLNMGRLQPTEEQADAIGLLRSGVPLIEVGSFAGTGKTSLFEMCVEAMPRTTKFLYIIFNKSGEKEAKERFARFDNITAKTVDALAYRNFPSNNITIGFYKRQDIERLLKLNNKEAKKTLALFEEFCNGGELCIHNANVQAFWDMMEAGKINPSFSFIKKTFHLNLALTPDNLPINRYDKNDVILLDEFQDTNPVTLEIAKLIRAKSYMRVGDHHQSIYGFRGASNVMGQDKEAVQCYLTQSFRFNQQIADKANAILSLYKGETKPLIGLSKQTSMKSACMISRTNAKLISVIQKLYDSKIPFKTIRDASALFDLPISIHSLQCGREARKSCTFLKWEHDKFKKENTSGSFIEYLEVVSKQNNDVELKTAAKIAKEISYDKLEKMEEQTNIYNKQEGLSVQYFLSSIHTAKGLEWDYVKIGDDIYDYAYLVAEHIYGQYGEVSNPSKYDFVESFKEDYQGGFVKESTIEEFNLLYVALTRAKVKVEYPNCVESLLDKETANKQIHAAYQEILEREEKQELSNKEFRDMKQSFYNDLAIGG